LAVEEQELPAAELAPDVERESDVVVAHLALHRRQRLEVGEQVAQVLELHALVGRIGKRRIVMASVGRGALPHGGEKSVPAPAADAVLPVGRDVRHVERSERRLQAEAAAELGAIVLAGRGMAGGAAAGIEDRLAVVDVGPIGAERARRYRRRDGDEPEHAEADDARHDRKDDQLAHHRRPPPYHENSATLDTAPRSEKRNGGASVWTAAVRHLFPDRRSGPLGSKSALLDTIALLAAT